MKRLGLIGVGAWGHRYIDTVARRQDCRIAAYARSSGRPEAALSDAVACSSVDQLLAMGQRGGLDGVIVATTAESQLQLAEASLVAGLAVLCEKPLGLSEAAVLALKGRLDAHQCPPPLVVDYVHLFAPAYLALKSLVHSTSSDRICAIESVGCNAGPYRAWSALYDWGVHELSLVLDLVGLAAPYGLRSARCHPAPNDARGELYEATLVSGDTSIHLGFGNGSQSKQRRFTVALESGRSLTYDDCEPVSRKLVSDGRPLEINNAMPLDCVVSHFLMCCTAWQQHLPVPSHSSMRLEFSARIAELLDQIGCMASPLSASDARRGP